MVRLDLSIPNATLKDIAEVKGIRKLGNGVAFFGFNGGQSEGFCYL